MPRLFQSELSYTFRLSGGVFVGMLAAALTEVLNVFPILAKRVGIEDRIIILIMAIVLGKIFGSLFHWIYFVNCNWDIKGRS